MQRKGENSTGKPENGRKSPESREAHRVQTKYRAEPEARVRENRESRVPGFGHSYRMQILMHVGLSTLITAIIEVFLITNLRMFSSYLEHSGQDQTVFQQFSLQQAAGVLLFVLFGIILFSVIFFLLQQRTARDIENLMRSVERMKNGDFSSLYDAPALEGDGEFQKIQTVIHEMAEDLSALMEKERDAEQSKTDLITNVAHDLRTPLTSILGYLDILRSGRVQDTEQQKKYLDIVYDKAKRLQKLIEELFGFTKLSYGRLNMHVRDLDLVSLLSQLLEENYPNFQKNQISYDFRGNVQKLPMQGDPDLIMRLFENLVTNAIKYGAEGKRVLVRLFSEREIAEVRVINYGRVIPERELPLLFDKFYRVEQSRSTKTGGTGLGLAIVKNIVELHHGSINVSSDLSGTVFTVRLPLHQEAEETEEGERE